MPRANGAARWGSKAAPSRPTALAAELQALVADQRARPRRVMAVVLSIETGGSSIGVGREVCEQHRLAVERQVVRYNGTVHSSCGRLVARFGDTYGALRCALALLRDLNESGVTFRVELHAGAVELRGTGVT